MVFLVVSPFITDCIYNHAVIFFYVLAVLGFQLRASYLLGFALLFELCPSSCFVKFLNKNFT
jgi:hypothetical protein